MNKVLDCNTMAGLRDLNKPRQIGDIINEMLRSDSPLAKDCRESLASKENIAKKGGEL